MFCALDGGVFAVSTDEDMWDNRYAHDRYNLAGNWEIDSIPAYAMFRCYGIYDEDPGRYLADNDDVMFISSNEDSFDPEDNYVIDLYREYYGMFICFERVESIDGWGIYRIKSTN